MTERLYHIGFGTDDLPVPPPTFAFLSGDPNRAHAIAAAHFTDMRVLSENRGLNGYVGRLANGAWALSCTSGMGAPSTSIVVNELAQLGVTSIIRVGTTGSIQPHVVVGDVVITSASLCNQGAALDIAPVEFPASADPFLTVALAQSAKDLGITAHIGVTASTDTFFEGQERSETSANPRLLRRLQGMTDEYQALGILNYEMESGTLLKMGLVYKIAVGCVCAVVAQRTVSESVRMDLKVQAIERAIATAVAAANTWTRLID